MQQLLLEAITVLVNLKIGALMKVITHPISLTAETRRCREETGYYLGRKNS